MVRAIPMESLEFRMRSSSVSAKTMLKVACDAERRMKMSCRVVDCQDAEFCNHKGEFIYTQRRSAKRERFVVKTPCDRAGDTFLHGILRFAQNDRRRDR